MQIWHAIRSAGDRFTARHYLNAIDLKPLPDGSIARQPPERRIYLSLLWRTFVVSLGITAICLLLGYPIAHLIAHSPPRIANLLLILVLVPFWTSLLVRTTSWIVLLQTQGVINDLLVTIGLIGDDGRLAMIYNMTGTLVAMTHVLLPFMILPLYSIMRAIPPSQMSAAASLGASSFQAFWPRVLAADPARRMRRIAAGIHPRHRLLHHPRAGRRQHRTTHLQHDRLPHADLPKLESGRGTWRHLAGMRDRALSALRPHSRH